MVSVAGIIGLLVIVLVNSAVTALMTRFFRVRLHTRWGSLVYSLLLCPVVMVVILLVLSGVFRLGANLGSQTAVILVTVIIPLAIGMTFDYFWMPAPDEVELPASMDCRWTSRESLLGPVRTRCPGRRSRRRERTAPGRRR